MSKLCFLLGDQLSVSISSLAAIDKNQDVVFMCEVKEEATYVKHHPKKIAFIFSAMRHFAEQLIRSGYHVRYVSFNDPKNKGDFAQELQRAVAEEHSTEVCITYPGEWRVLQIIEQLKKQMTIPITVYEDNRYLCAINEFKEWAQGKNTLRMEYFYRMLRKKHRILMDQQGKPVGGSWNYDALNRKNANHIPDFPKRPEHLADSITIDVLKLVDNNFSDHFGDLFPFNFAVTREQALRETDYFMAHLLADFGAYQDAMRTHEIYLYHSRLSFYLNAGLLLPLELCQMAERAYRNQHAPLNSVEGFIRQILGWREYVRGIYWLNMPAYANENYFRASRPLPALFWGQDTKMFCMEEVIRQTRVAAYSHHIQRLMITGNFALLAGLDPKQVCEWYLAVYADAYEWVELPNTLGMALYADGGLMASKPYAASGKYIHRMSDFCKSCYYTPNEVEGEKACPFNSLYWHFLKENEEKLKDNSRLHYSYLNWHKMTAEKKETILNQATQVLAKLDKGNL
ncbi:MAG: cryptochrome/photolyase family protein [Legionella sp.]|nr:cryptochrome/photolyase family protein [Legionella sp.]